MESTTEWIVDRGAIRSDAPWQPSHLIITVGSLGHPASGLARSLCDDAELKNKNRRCTFSFALSMRLNPRNHGDFCWFSKVRFTWHNQLDQGRVIRRNFLCPFVPMRQWHLFTSPTNSTDNNQGANSGFKQKQPFNYQQQWWQADMLMRGSTPACGHCLSCLSFVQCLCPRTCKFQLH